MTKKKTQADDQHQPKGRDEKGLYGLVADILNEREVVLNVGERDGVTIGMHFGILDERDYEITDPETGESLGKLPSRVKVKVKVVQVTEKLSVARTFETHTKNVGGIGFGSTPFGGMFEAPKYVQTPVTFRIGSTGATYYKQIKPEESIVQIGDRVRELQE